ncbi:MAG: hypothetical protein SF051_07395 [Elusimicrobiota bacterium]|nr:hypothetical protein [Elusimicrobiota bacterium]
MRTALLLAAALLAGCAGTPRGPRLASVRAEGWAPVGPEGRAHARDRALADALRRAAERGAGVVVEGRTAVRDAVTLDTSVLTRSRGVVRSWLVLGERVVDGVLELGVLAQVEEGRGPGRTVALRLADARAEAGVARALAEKGVETDRRASTRVSGTAVARALRASVFPGTETFRAGAELVLDDGDGRARRFFAEASALDPDGELAAAKAVEAAGYKAGLALADALSGDGPR